MIVPPIALLPGHSFFAAASFTIATSGASSRSASVNSRPRTTEIPIVRKYPGVTCCGIADGAWLTGSIGDPSTRIDQML